MSTFAIVAASHYLHGVGDDEVLPSLDARMQALCRERYRRIDRFILLAVLGSAECATKTTLREDCGVYLSSGIGPLTSNTQVQEQLVRDRQLPKPFNFVNTLGSAAGHHVSKNLRLIGQSLFISRRGGAFKAALAIAATDLELGIVSQALIGAVEECTLPLDFHRFRQGLSSDVKVAEGSHWILLELGARAGCATLELSSNGTKLAESSYAPDLPFHDSIEAARLTHWLSRRDTQRFVASDFRVE